MEIAFETDYLKDLFYEGQAKDKHHRFQRSIVGHGNEQLYTLGTLEFEQTSANGYQVVSIGKEAL